MRTAQVIRRLRFEEWGGTENVVWNSVRELKKLGVDSEILATRALGGAGDETVDGVRVRRFPYCYPWFPLTAARRRELDKKGGNPFCFAMERRLAEEPFDLIHCHNAGRLAELSARAAERRGVPLVLSFHGGCLEVPQEERTELVRPLRHTFPWGGVLERLAGWKRDPLALADGLICVGENELKLLRERCPGTRVIHLPNGVDPEKFSVPVSFDWRRELEISAETRLILCVSRIDYQKNQLLLVELAARLAERGDDFHLLLVGPVTSAWYRRKLEEEIVRRRLEKRVTLIPGLGPDDPGLVAAYRAADLFVLPSKHEPFGIVVLEAWSAGVPVVAARVGGLGRLVDSGRTGLLFEPDSAEDLLHACDAAGPLREKLAEAGLREVRERYSWARVSARLRDFYREVRDGFAATHSLRR